MHKLNRQNKFKRMLERLTHGEKHNLSTLEKFCVEFINLVTYIIQS
jgi:hypothetical protein